MPVIKLHEGGRHTGNSLMRDAGVDEEVRMREVGHGGRDINDRYTHVLIEAHRGPRPHTDLLMLTTKRYRALRKRRGSTRLFDRLG